MYQQCSVGHCALPLPRFFCTLCWSIGLFWIGFSRQMSSEMRPFIFLTKLLPVWPTFKSQNISGFIAYSLYMLHVKLPKWRWKLWPQHWQHSLPFLQQRRHSVRKTKYGLCWSMMLRHYIPLRQRAGHLCVHKVGLELAFALDVDDASARAHVAQSLKDATCLLCHL